MARRRRPTAEEKRIRAEHERLRLRSAFEDKVRAASTTADVLALITTGMPSTNAPDRVYYSNLAFFWNQGSVPDGASADELRLYRDLLRRIDAAGELSFYKPGALAALERSLDEAIEARG